MKIKIMKFGGTSLSDPEKIRLAAGRAAAEKKRGFSVVLVLSAPGQVTDELLELARRLNPDPHARELDALLSTGESLSVTLAAMALEAAGHRAVSLSGAQAGILTNSAFSNASVLALNPKRIIAELKKGKIAVVAGFQGVNRSGDITTLGRGGSDLTAVALAAALKAEICELYSDVKGIYTANPAIVSSARKLPRVSYEEVMALAEAGTEVRQLRAVACAKKHKITLVLRSSFDSEPGTLVGDFKHAGKKPEVRCFCMRKTGKHSEITLIGSMLNSAEIKSAVRRSALANGCQLEKDAYFPAKATLLTDQHSGENMLKVLHKVFIGRRAK
ncbi:MAG: aspartate kinase [Elusimicrobia bacterium]|nr:aspartate kinase [Elusimicrobiota bacterium]